MNNHDIELPPLPSPFGIVDPDGAEEMMHYTIRDLQDYAKAYAITAIEADRKQKGVVVVTRTQDGEIVAVTRQDDEGRILSVIAEASSKRNAYQCPVCGSTSTQAHIQCLDCDAESVDSELAKHNKNAFVDRKRRGEPIANLWVNPETLEFEVDNCNHPIDELVPVYEAPQPADRSTGEPVARSIRYSLDQKIFDAAAKENDLVHLYIRETEADQYSTESHRALNELYKASDTLRELMIEHLYSDDAPQPAEPVKDGTPLGKALEGINSYFASKKAVEPVKVPSDDDVFSRLYEIANRDTAVSVTVRADDLRALLARYGSTTDEATKQQKIE